MKPAQIISEMTHPLFGVEAQDLTPWAVLGGGATVAVTAWRLFSASFFQALTTTSGLVAELRAEIARKDADLTKKDIRISELEQQIRESHSREQAAQMRLLSLRATGRASDGPSD